MREPVTVNECTHPDGYKWRVRYPDGGKRKNKYFRKKTGKKGADEWAASKLEELAKDGSREGEITAAERRAIHRFREGVANLPGNGGKATLADAVEAYLSTLGRRHKSVEVHIVADSLLTRVKAEGGGKRHLDTLRNRLDRFGKEYGDWMACDVSTEILNEWLAGLTVPGPSEVKLVARTRNHYRAALRQLFRHAVEIGAAESNPVERTIKPKVKNGETGVFKPKEVADLLANAPDEILAGLALGFFTGVRMSELNRMDWEEIDFNQGLIQVKASKAKTAQRRLIPMRPSLRKWLQLVRKPSGPVMPTEMIWRTRLEVAKKAAKVEEWPHNGARHSFASYHLARFKNAAEVALELGHTNADVVFKHYHALVSPQAARAFWKIAPATKKQRKNIIPLAERRAG